MIETKEVAQNLAKVLPSLPKMDFFLDENGLFLQEVLEINNRKVKKLLPVPEIIYQNNDTGVGNLQSGLDQAFDLLFEATIKKMSTNTD